MKIFIDTNVLIDYYADRKPFSDDAEKIVNFSNVAWDAYISVLSFANIAYVFRKELTKEKTEAIKRDLDIRMNLVSLESSDIDKAIALSFGDFEDALQTSAAIKIKADYIISRNTEDFTGSPVPCLSPSEFLVLLQTQ